MEVEEDVIIYGIGKVQKDFEYIFTDLFVHGYLTDNKCGLEKWNNKPVYTLKEIDAVKRYKIVICDFDKEEKSHKLEQAGMKHYEHYLIADDLFYKLDVPLTEIVGSRDVYLWGTGCRAGEFLQKTEYINHIKGCIDNDAVKKNQIFFGKKVWHPSQIEAIQWKEMFIVVAADAYNEIKVQLEHYGLEEQKDFVWFRYLVPSELLKRTMYDNSQYNLVCDTMFHTYEIESTGQVSCCCTTFINERIGNLICQDFDKIWRSNVHKILCLSAANKTYTFCKKDMCPVLMGKAKYQYENSYEESEQYRKIEDKPKVMLISIDSSCNLYCASCRNCVKVLQGAELKKAEIMADKLLSDDNLDHSEFIIMAGNGEVFFSKIYERIWSSTKTKHVKRFRLLSNGTMFTRAKWDRFMAGRTSEVAVTFSIDAATEETYRVLRRGGHFEQLMENLKFASELRKTGRLGYFQISFVVQRKNYQEMPDFVRLGKELGVDKVFFTRILDWGTYEKNGFMRMAMTDERGYANADLQEILDMPIMQDPIVDLGTINAKSNKAEWDYIYNYYIWEIERYLDKQKEQTG